MGETFRRFISTSSVVHSLSKDNSTTRRNIFNLLLFLFSFLFLFMFLYSFIFCSFLVYVFIFFYILFFSQHGNIIRSLNKTVVSSNHFISHFVGVRKNNGYIFDVGTQESFVNQFRSMRFHLNLLLLLRTHFLQNFCYISLTCICIGLKRI